MWEATFRSHKCVFSLLLLFAVFRVCMSNSREQRKLLVVFQNKGMLMSHLERIAAWEKGWKILIGSKSIWKTVAHRRILFTCYPLAATKEEIDCQMSSCLSKYKAHSLHKRQNDPMVHAEKSKVIVILPLSAHVFYSQQVYTTVSVKCNIFLSKRESCRWSLFFSLHKVVEVSCATLKRNCFLCQVFSFFQNKN